MKSIGMPKNRSTAGLFLVLVFGWWFGMEPRAAGVDSFPGAIGPHHRRITSVDEAGRARNIVEIGTGMHYWNGNHWASSDPGFEAGTNFFMARHIAHKVRLDAQLNYAGSVEVLTPDGIELKSTPVAIRLYDTASGLAAIIATLTNATGIPISSNQIIYQNAFAGVCADVIYTVHRESFEQDVVITGKLNPADYGFNTNSTRIQIVTEFFDAPTPERVVRPIWVEKNQTVRNRMATPDLVDESLGFGEMVLGTGRASRQRAAARQSAASAPVAKEFVSIGNRTFLIESVAYASIAQDLADLPACDGSGGHGSIQRKRGKEAYASIPSPPKERQFQANLRTVTPAFVRSDVSRPDGVVIDYLATISGTVGSATVYAGDTTYFVSSSVVHNGAVTIEGGSVFKFKQGTSIRLNSTLTCKTGMYRPAVFTAIDDDCYGDSLSSNTNYVGSSALASSHYANPALWAYYISAQMSGLRFLYCQEAVRCEGGTGSTLSHSQLINCIRGIVITGCSGSGSGGGSGSTVTPLTVNNTLIGNVTTPITINWANTAQYFYHCTVDTGTTAILAQASSVSCAFTNSIFANFTTLYSGGPAMSGTKNGYYKCTTPYIGISPIIYNSTNPSPFQTVAAGNYYLTSGSGFRGVGTTGGVSSVLLSQLKLRTTYPPSLLGNPSVSTALAIQATRDTGSNPDLGYHYDPLDYLANGSTVTGGTLSLGSGVTLGLAGNTGLTLGQGTSLASSGTPLLHNHLSRYTTVQEQPTAYGHSRTNVDVVPATSSSASSIECHFTDFDGLASGGTQLYSDSVNSSSAILIRDCAFNSAAVTLGGTSSGTVTFDNNLLERVQMTFRDYPSMVCYNNLFKSGSITFTKSAGVNSWAVQNNSFDATSITNSPNPVSHNYNGYLNGSGRLTPNGANDQVVSSFSYKNGPLGNYYHSTTNLMNVGSTTADLAGLYDYTTITNALIKETNSVVDIGFHYVALNSQNQPIDANSDSLSDYLGDVWILTPPVGAILCQGNNYAFSVVACGATPLSYQWSKGGIAISGATAATLSLTGLALSDSGSYSVRVSGGAGSIATSGVALSVLTPLPPQIITQPANQWLRSGDTCTLMVGTWSALPMTYQWKLAGLPLAGATQSTYSISGVGPNDVGKYSVVVQNCAGATNSANADVTIYYKLTAGANPGGSVVGTPPQANYRFNGQVSVMAAPIDGYAFNGWSGDACGLDNPLIVTMTSAKNITANFVSISPNVIVNVAADSATGNCYKSGAWLDSVRGDLVSSANSSNFDAPMLQGWTPPNSITPHYVYGAFDSSTSIVCSLDFAPNIIAPGPYKVYLLYVTDPPNELPGSVRDYYESYSVPAENKVDTYEVVGLSSGSVAMKLTGTDGVTYFGEYPGSPTAPSFDGNYLFDESRGGGYWRFLATHNFGAGENRVLSIEDRPTYQSSVSAGIIYNFITKRVVTASAARFECLAPPFITAGPLTQSIPIGGATTLTVSAAGAGPFNYQWRLNHVPIPQATNSFLELVNFSGGNSNFDVVLANQYGIRTSSVSTLTVDYSPRIIQLPRSQSVHLGANTAFGVFATGPQLSYQWLFNGNAIAGATNSTLTINNVQANIQGSYSVVVANSWGSATSPWAWLAIDWRPVIVSQPQSASVSIASAAHFSVVATGAGYSPLAYQWFRNGKALTDATDSAFTIDFAQSEHAGRYTVSVIDSVGGNTYSNLSTVANLTVNTDPNIWAPPGLVMVDPLFVGPEPGSFPPGFVVPFHTLLVASHATDPQDQPITFQIKSVENGTLTINGRPFAAGAFTLEQNSWSGNCYFDTNSVVVWTPFAEVPNSGVAAFKVVAFNTAKTSGSDVEVTIIPFTKTRLFGWGSNEFGSLGIGQYLTRGGNYSGYPAPDPHMFPVPVIGLNEVVSVAQSDAGAEHTGAAVTADGRLWMWGWEDCVGLFGEGQPSISDYSAPYASVSQVVRPTPFVVQMKDANGQLQDFGGLKAVAMDQRVLALKADGTVWSWGDASTPGLGYVPDPSDRLYWREATKKARKVEGIVDSDGNDIPVTQIVAAGSSLALDKFGDVWSWGQIELDQILPDPGSQSGGYMPVPYFLSLGNPVPDSNVPQRLGGFTYTRPEGQTFFQVESQHVAQVAGSAGHFLALRNDGTVSEFGYLPGHDVSQTPDLAGVDLKTCGTYCFFSPTPVPVAGLPYAISAVAAGDRYSLALDTNGNVWAWGILEDGVTYVVWGDGLQWKSATPVQIPELHDIVAISAKGSVFVALDASGVVWTWGRNYDGEFGILPDFVNSVGPPNPHAVGGIENVTAIFASNRSIFALGSSEGGAPSQLLATALNQSVQLDWRPFPNAQSYNIYRTSTSGDYANAVRLGNVSNNSFVDATSSQGTPQNGTTYYYTVTAVVGGVESLHSREVSATPVSPPGAPTWLDSGAVVQNCRSITLKWNADSTVTAYHVYRTESANATPYVIGSVQKSVGPIFTDSTLPSTDTSTHYYYVAGINGVVEGAKSGSRQGQLNPAECLHPPTITGWSAESIPDQPGLGRITVSWTPPDNGSADTYRIKWYLGKNPPTATSFYTWKDVPVASLTQTTTGFSYVVGDLNGVIAAHLYWFKVSAIANGQEGNDSAVQGPAMPDTDCLPLTPVVRTVGGYGQVYLEWRDDPKAQNYLVSRCNTDGSIISSFPATTQNRFWDTGFPTGTPTLMHYKVQAFGADTDFGGNSMICSGAPSAVVSATTTQTAPSTIAIDLHADHYDGLVYLNWGWTPLSTVLQFFAERKITGEPDSSYEAVSGVAFGTGFVDINVINGTSYDYRVIGLDPYYFRSISSTVTVVPTADGNLHLRATPGNSYVDLDWNPLANCVFEVRHSRQPGGPYEIVAAGLYGHSFRVSGLWNNVPHYFVVSATTPFNRIVDSPEAAAMPLGTLKTAPPGNLKANISVSGGAGKILLTWQPPEGAVSYQVSQVLGSESILTQGPDCGYVFSVPEGTEDNTQFTFYVRALNSLGIPSDPAQVTLSYAVPDESVLAILLSVGGVSDPLTVSGPTNLTLRASLRSTDPTVKHIYFYRDGSLIGTGDAPNAQMTWFNVPAGNGNLITAQAVSEQASIPGITAATGQTYDSQSVALTVKVLPELGSFQTAATDLQLPAPGLSLNVSRSYDSRRGDDTGSLGRGWIASWEEAAIEIANPGNVSSPLATGWIQAGQNVLNGRKLISEAASHLVTVTLPGGAKAYFAPDLNILGGGDPFMGDNTMLRFSGFAPAQGALSCQDGLGDSSALNVDPGAAGLEWSSNPLTLVRGDAGSGSSAFQPTVFIYTSPDGTEYDFVPIGGKWKLVLVIDRNGNSLSYGYYSDADTDARHNQLQVIKHSNGRQVKFDYAVNGVVTTISVADSTAAVDPVVKYQVTASGGTKFLTEIDRLVVRSATGPPVVWAVYESTTFTYGTTGANQNLLTQATDPRGVVVLLNNYGTNPDNVADGRLLTQTDALGRASTFAIDANNQLTVSRTVNGVAEQSIVVHDNSGAIAKVQSSTGDPGTTFVYDKLGRLVSQTDALGQTKTTAYDANNRPVSQSDPLGSTTSTVLNAAGQPLATTDANGNTNYFSYDDGGNPTAAADSASVQTTYAYQPPITDSGHVLLAAGLVASETKVVPGVPFVLKTLYTYYNGTEAGGLAGELKSVVQEWVDKNGDPSGQTVATTYGYDANGNKVAETNYARLDGSTLTPIITRYQYDPQNRLIATTDPLGRTSRIVYNNFGKQASTTDALGRTTSFVYDAVGNLTETTYPDLSITRTIYDEKNRAVLSLDRTGLGTGNNSLPSTATKTHYDDNGRVDQVLRYSNVVLARNTDSFGNVWMTVSGSLSTPDSGNRTVYYDNGQVHFSMDAHGAVTESLYDAAGRRSSSRIYTNYVGNPLSISGIAFGAEINHYAETTYGYDPAGNQIAVTNALGLISSLVYDQANRVIQSILPHQVNETPLFIRSTVYDGLGRRVREIDEAGVITAFAYDFRGLLTAVTLDAGKNGPTTLYEYDEAGNQISQTDALGRTTRFQYDVLGRRAKRILPDGSQESIAYSDIPETSGSTVLLSQQATTDFRANTITTVQDRMGRLRTRILPAVNSGEGITNLNFYYTISGQIDHVNTVDAVGNITRSTQYWYDTLNRLARKDNPEGTLTYQYTTDNHVSTLKAYRRGAFGLGATIPGGTSPDVSLTYGYDPLGRLSTVLDNVLATANPTTYYYDNVGNLDHFVYPNGVQHKYRYDSQNRLQQLDVQDNAGTLLRRYSYSVSPTGQRTGVTEYAGSAATQRRKVGYQYDWDNVNNLALARVNRLTQESFFDASSAPAGTIQHAHDAVGNRVTRTVSGLATPTGDTQNNQSLAFDVRELIDGDATTNNVNARYDGNGNSLTDESGIATGDVYDAENRLIKRTAGSSLSISYDHEGNRVSKQVGSTTTYYLVDEANPTGYAQVVAEYANTSNPPDRAYTYGLELISQRRNTGSSSSPAWTTSYYGYDGQGSVRLLTDATSTSATGGGMATAVTDTYDYDAFGLILAQNSSASATPNHYRYTGQQWDEDLGMYYLRARYYKPDIGRFWTMDTYQGFKQVPASLHKYLYCAADPVNHTDPSGHFMEGVGGLFTATSLQTGLRGLQGGSITIPGQIAARGFMKWAWLAGGIGAGVQTLMQDTQFAMDMQLMMQSNPTDSKWAYQNLKCTEFATDAMTYFRTKGTRGKQPQRIIYDVNPGMSRGWIVASDGFGFFGGQVISENGHHEGVLYDKRVFDNNVPFGVSRTKWEEGYELFILGQGEMTIGESARKGFGTIKVE